MRVLVRSTSDSVQILLPVVQVIEERGVLVPSTWTAVLGRRVSTSTTLPVQDYNRTGAAKTSLCVKWMYRDNDWEELYNCTCEYSIIKFTRTSRSTQPATHMTPTTDSYVSKLSEKKAKKLTVRPNAVPDVDCTRSMVHNFQHKLLCTSCTRHLDLYVIPHVHLYYTYCWELVFFRNERTNCGRTFQRQIRRHSRCHTKNFTTTKL
jgi:hypothetical protein